MPNIKEHMMSPVTQAQFYLPLLQAIMKEATPNRWNFLSKEQVKEEMNQIIDEYWSIQEAPWPFNVDNEDDNEDDETDDEW